MEESQQFLGRVLEVSEGGTIKIPQDVLETACIRLGGRVEVFSNNSYLFIRTTENFCDSCGSNGGTQQLGKFKLCASCIDNLRSQIQEV